MVSVVDTQSCEKMAGVFSPFLFIIQRGEYLHDAFKICMEKAKFGGAAFCGLGALQDPVIAYFHLPTKEYEKKTFPGLYELISVNGTIARNSKNDIIVHAHVTIGDREHNVMGGHLISGMIGITGEMMVTPFKETIVRHFDSFCGLELIRP